MEAASSGEWRFLRDADKPTFMHEFLLIRVMKMTKPAFYSGAHSTHSWSFL